MEKHRAIPPEYMSAGGTRKENSLDKKAERTRAPLFELAGKGAIAASANLSSGNRNFLRILV